MNLADFRRLVTKLSAEVPAEFLDGISEITVSPRAVPHPTRGEIFTLGHCIPFHAGETGAVDEIQSRVVLYYGSFLALAELDPGFDWRGEAWETLTHELRHHLEWRAREGALEAFDEAAEENFARGEGEAFDPLFFLDGEAIADDIYQVDDDYFLDHIVRRLPAALEFGWHGRRYRAMAPAEATLPAFLTVEGIADPPPGDLVLVFRRPSGLLNFLKQAAPFRGTVSAEPAGSG
ncbi:MAG: metallopeptidase family protein [Gemmatimonadales bacterium]